MGIVQNQLDDLLKEFQKELTIAAKQVLIKKGIENDSDLIKTMKYEYEDSKNMFVLIANDYYTYVSTGRRIGVRKVPIQDLIDWIRDKSIAYTGSINNAAFRIQNAIYKNGIKGKKYQDPVVEIGSEMVSEYTAEELSQIIVDDLVLILEQNN